MARVSQVNVRILDANYPNYQAEHEILATFQPIIQHQITDGIREKIALAVQGADAVMVRELPITAEVIEAMDRCKVIVRYGVGVDNIDLRKAKEHRIYVANVPDYGSQEVSDHALGLLLAVSRHISRRDRAVRTGVWGIGAREPIFSFDQKILGLIGYGRIGRAFHRKASTLGFARTLVYDPYLTDIANHEVELVSLDYLCSQADAISLHLPLTKENYHLLDESRFSVMKPTAVVINTSRGGLIDEEVLAERLREGKLFGAGLDVFEFEPLGLNNPLVALDNVVLTDHTAWYSQESLYDLQKKAALEVARVLAGERPLSWVNRWEG